MSKAQDHSWAAVTPAAAVRDIKTTPRVLFLRLSGERSRYAANIADCLSGEDWPASVWEASQIERSVIGSRFLRFLQPFEQVGSDLRALVRELPSSDIVHIPCDSPRQLIREALPALILARFFAKRPVLHFVGADIDLLLEQHRRWLAPILRLSSAAAVGSRHLQKVLGRAGLPAKLLAAPLTFPGITHRVRQRLQPKILIDTALELDLNVQASIRAFRLVKQKYPRAELVILGGGSQRNNLEELVRQSRINGVEFLGVVDWAQRVELYNTSDLFLHAPLLDESPPAIVAAFAAGLPVVVSDCDGLLHMVRDRVNALVVPMSDHAALADAMLELVENQELCERLSAAGRTEAEKFVWSRVRQDWVNLYKTMVN